MECLKSQDQVWELFDNKVSLLVTIRRCPKFLERRSNK